MIKAIEGGCRCGQVRYQLRLEQLPKVYACHCRDCQRLTGGGFVAGLLVPSSAFRLTKGQLRYYFTAESCRRQTQARLLRRVRLASHGWRIRRAAHRIHRSHGGQS